MSVHYSPFHSFNVTSKSSAVNRLIHLTDLTPEDQSILAGSNDTKPGSIEEKDLLDPHPEEDQDAVVIKENTNYSPDRGFINTPAGNSSGDDITPPVYELEKESSNDGSALPPMDDEDDYTILTNKRTQEVPSAVVDYTNEAAIPGSETHKMVKTALGISDQEGRTREDVIRDHIAYNAQFFNAIYYGTNYAKSITTMGGLDFLEYFYPDMGTHSFFVYVHSAIGKLVLHADLYQKLGMRIPLISEPSDPIGWKDLSERDQGVLEDLILQYYDAQENWFNTDISDDMDHLIYCVRLYAILDKIMRDPNFNMDDLKPEHLNILGQWERRVQEWYNHFQETEEYTEPWYQAIQHLHDLCWNFTDNPDSPDVHAENIVNMTCAMAGGTDPAKGDHTLITKADCDKYLIQQLGFDDSIYLIPEKMEYPVLNKHSLKLAMDSIPRVAKEYPDDLNTFVKNVNRKYKELGCTFSITADHPFAQYADPAIVDNMFSVLSEGDTAVNDTDGAANIGSPNNKTDQPWYKRLDYTGTLYRDGSENKEMGPNAKPMQKPDWTQHYSIL